MINLHNIDCMKFMADKPDNYYDLAIVDPPYQNADAIGLKDNGGIKKQAAKRTQYKQFDNIKPKDEYFNELKRVSKNQIVWGGNYFGLAGGVIAWNKNGTAFGEGEVAICSTHNSVRFYEFTWNGMIQGDMKHKEYRIHPTQKPIKLYEWLLMNFAKEGDKILDTHGGSGSICIAAHNLGFNLDWCELDKEYFEAAKKRFEIHRSQQRLFI